MNVPFDLDATVEQVRTALNRDDIASAISLLERLKAADQVRLIDELGPHDAAEIVSEMEPGDAADIVAELSPENAADLVAELEPQEQADLLTELKPEDSAEIVAEFAPQAQADLIERMSAEDAADIVVEMSDEDQADIAGRTSDKRLAAMLDEMEPDDAADMLGDLEEDRKQRVLSGMLEADDVRPLLIYPDESAGGLMTTSFLALRPGMTARDALNALREWDHNDELPYYLFVVDGERHLLGVVGLRPLVTAAPDRPVQDMMHRDVITVLVGTDQEQCAQLLKKYGFLALPVIDAENRLLGVITNDDLMDVVEEEAAEDAFKLSGVNNEEGLFAPVRTSMSKRLPWLLINLGTAFLASWVANQFEDTIKLVPILAALQSLVAGQGGNAASQRIAIVVRGIATGDFNDSDTGRLLLKEVFIGFLQGLAMALLVGVGVYAWQGNATLAAVMAVAMIGNMLVAGLVGPFVPVLLHRFKFDPALSSAVIVTTFTDCFGFLFSLGLASLLIRVLV